MTSALLSNGGPPLDDDDTYTRTGASQAVRQSRMESSGGAFQDQKAMSAMREWQCSKSSNAPRPFALSAHGLLT